MESLFIMFYVKNMYFRSLNQFNDNEFYIPTYVKSLPEKKKKLNF